MRSLVVATALLASALLSTSTVEAKPRRAKKSVATKPDKSERSTKSKRAKKNERSKRGKKRVALANRKHARVVIHGPIEGQSVGACWSGYLRDPAKLEQ